MDLILKPISILGFLQVETVCNSLWSRIPEERQSSNFEAIVVYVSQLISLFSVDVLEGVLAGRRNKWEGRERKG